MKTKQLLEELKELAGELGLEVREVKGNFKGGRCTVDDHDYIMLNSRDLPEVRAAVLADALREEPLDTVYIKPAVRRAIEDREAADTSTSHA